MSANASDDVGVAGVQFQVDGANLGAEDTAPPYSVSWNTTATANGSHALTAVARDAAGNVATAAGVVVTVSNDTTAADRVDHEPPRPGPTVAGTVAVSANASDNVAVVGVQFKLDGANLGAEDTASPYSVSWNTTGAANGSHTLIAVARDAAGNVNTSAGVAVTVANDTTPPSVSITAPAAASTVSGTVAVSASASDNVAVVGVQFKLDGANLGAEDTTSPYSVSWNTTAAANGSHTLTAVARDAAGNVNTSAGVAVTVSNDTTPPSVSITAPAAAATVSGSGGRLRQRERQRRRRRRAVQARRRQPRRGGHHVAVLGLVEYDRRRQWQPCPDRGRPRCGGQRDDLGRRHRHRVERLDTAVGLHHGPAAAATVSGTVAVSASASDNVARRRRAVQARRSEPRRGGHERALLGVLDHDQRVERQPHPDRRGPRRGGQSIRRPPPSR